MTDQKKKLRKTKISLALYHELGRRPSIQEIECFSSTARVLYQAILGLHFERSVQKEEEQLPLF